MVALDPDDVAKEKFLRNTDAYQHRGRERRSRGHVRAMTRDIRWEISSRIRSDVVEGYLQGDKIENPSLRVPTRQIPYFLSLIVSIFHPRVSLSGQGCTG